MKFAHYIFKFGNRKKVKEKTIAQYKEDVLLKEGTEQFKKLVRSGLRVPVFLM